MVMKFSGRFLYIGHFCLAESRPLLGWDSNHTRCRQAAANSAVCPSDAGKWVLSEAIVRAQAVVSHADFSHLAATISMVPIIFDVPDTHDILTRSVLQQMQSRFTNFRLKIPTVA